MLPQPIVDALIVLGMFLLRIGLPIILLFALGYWLQKKMHPQEADKPSQRTAGARLLPFRQSQTTSSSSTHCWDVKHCDLTVRAQCPAYASPDLPCWLALQAAGVKLRDECHTCEWYKPKYAAA